MYKGRPTQRTNRLGLRQYRRQLAAQAEQNEFDSHQVTIGIQCPCCGGVSDLVLSLYPSNELDPGCAHDVDYRD